MIIITDKAAKEVRRTLEEQGMDKDKVHLRVAILGGGCSGYKNKLDLDEFINEKTDNTYEINGVKVVIDKRSALYLEGATIDYLDDLNQKGFSVINPNSKSTCGCGSSFTM